MIAFVCLVIVLLISIICNICSFIIINNKLKIIDTYEGWVIVTRDKLHNAYLKIKSIDDRQMFEKDEDVGFIFSEILNIAKELDEKIEETEETEDQEDIEES